MLLTNRNGSVKFGSLAGHSWSHGGSTQILKFFCADVAGGINVRNHGLVMPAWWQCHQNMSCYGAPYQCHLCEKSYKQAESLKNHVFVKHLKMSHREVYPGAYCEHDRHRQTCSICSPRAYYTGIIRKRIRHVMQQKGSKKNMKTQQILGCSPKQLLNHLQKKVEYWNTTYGTISGIFLQGEFELDHIKPLRTAKTAEEVNQLNHYTNLQLIWKHANKVKQGTWSEEDEKFWAENIFQNPDYLNVYLPASTWSVVFPSVFPSTPGSDCVPTRPEV